MSNIRGIAGTLGAIVSDTHTGAPCVLSNAHVLQTFEGPADDAVVQPGVNDDGNVNANVIGRVLAATSALPAIVRSRRSRPCTLDASILELDVSPRRVAKAELGDVVVEVRPHDRRDGWRRDTCGRRGLAQLRRRDRSSRHRRLRSGAQAGRTGQSVISKGGDSGAIFMIEESGVTTDIGVGLNFAVDASELINSGHALACPLHSLVDKLAISFTA